MSIIQQAQPLSWRTAFFACSFLLFMGACSQEENSSSASSASPILLSGSMGDSGISASTRGVLDGSSTGAINVSFIRRDQGTDGAYPSYAALSPVKATRAAVAGSTAGVITFAEGSEQYYLVRETNNNTALIGWYPQVDAGSTYADGVITFSDLANGVTDVMLTKEQTGNKTTAVGSFAFEHVLAQIQVKAKAVDDSAAVNWGQITGITLKGVKGTCTVTLPTETTVSTTLLTPDFGTATTTNITLKAVGSDTQIALTEAIPTTAGSTGAAFCYGLFPPTGGNTLALDVVTEKGGTRSVTATLNSGTVVRGNIYTITLEFKSTDITPTATISSWGAGSGASVEM